MRAILALSCMLLLASAARAEDSEMAALELFQSACLHDEQQFDRAMALASERALPVPPAALRDALVSKGAGAAWLAGDEPVLALYANIDGGCGVMMKPVDESSLDIFADGRDGATLILEDRFQGAWSRWYALERQGMRGVLLVGYFGDTEKPSGFLRYLPALDLADDFRAQQFLLMDERIFKAVRKALPVR
jgi:hypothetical protein